MSIDKLLSPLRGVKQTGNGRFVAQCPAHQDKSPSLAVREMPDGKILIHCFAGCSAAEVLAAIGLSLEDLFPEKQEGYSGAKAKRPWVALDVLRCISGEAIIVAIAANSVAQGVPLPEADRKRLLIAASRLSAAMEVANGNS